MIDKKIFIKTINFIKETKEKIRKVDEALHAISNDFLDLSGILFYYEDTLLILLESLAPKNKASYISWWMYETSFGKKNTEIYNEKHNIIANLKTAEDLYNYVFEEKEQL